MAGRRPQNDQNDPHAAALSQVEHDTAGQQDRIRSADTREKRKAKAKEARALKDDLTIPPEGKNKVARDTARYEALAREHGADLSEEGFNEALRRTRKA